MVKPRRFLLRYGLGEMDEPSEEWYKWGTEQPVYNPVIFMCIKRWIEGLFLRKEKYMDRQGYGLITFPISVQLIIFLLYTHTTLGIHGIYPNKMNIANKLS